MHDPIRGMGGGIQPVQKRERGFLEIQASKKGREEKY